MFLASAAAYGIGYYVALAVMFSINGLNGASAAPWEIATIGLGSLLAGFAAKLVSPKPGWVPVITAVAGSVLALLAGLLIDIGFDYGIGTGVVVALGTALTAYASPAA